jgi:hypothetical protein
LLVWGASSASGKASRAVSSGSCEGIAASSSSRVRAAAKGQGNRGVSDVGNGVGEDALRIESTKGFARSRREEEWALYRRGGSSPAGSASVATSTYPVAPFFRRSSGLTLSGDLSPTAALGRRSRRFCRRQRAEEGCGARAPGQPGDRASSVLWIPAHFQCLSRRFCRDGGGNTAGSGVMWVIGRVQSAVAGCRWVSASRRDRQAELVIGEGGPRLVRTVVRLCRVCRCSTASMLGRRERGDTLSAPRVHADVRRFQWSRVSRLRTPTGSFRIPEVLAVSGLHCDVRSSVVSALASRVLGPPAW